MRLTRVSAPHIVRGVNNSGDKPSRRACCASRRTEADRAELLERLDGVMHRFGRLMASRQAQYSRDTGLPAPQYMVLRTLLQEGEMRVSDIASTLGVKNPAASGLIQMLEDDGLVVRRSDTEDHRVVLVSITPEGEARFAAADRYRLVVMGMLTDGLPVSDVETLVRVMEHMAQVVNEESDLPAAEAARSADDSTE